MAFKRQIVADFCILILLMVLGVRQGDACTLLDISNCYSNLVGLPSDKSADPKYVCPKYSDAMNCLDGLSCNFLLEGSKTAAKQTLNWAKDLCEQVPDVDDATPSPGGDQSEPCSQTEVSNCLKSVHEIPPLDRLDISKVCPEFKKTSDCLKRVGDSCPELSSNIDTAENQVEWADTLCDTITGITITTKQATTSTVTPAPTTSTSTTTPKATTKSTTTKSPKPPPSTTATTTTTTTTTKSTTKSTPRPTTTKTTPKSTAAQTSKLTPTSTTTTKSTKATTKSTTTKSTTTTPRPTTTKSTKPSPKSTAAQTPTSATTKSTKATTKSTTTRSTATTTKSTKPSPRSTVTEASDSTTTGCTQTDVTECTEPLAAITPQQRADQSFVCPKLQEGHLCLDALEDECPDSLGPFIDTAFLGLQWADTLCSSFNGDDDDDDNGDPDAQTVECSQSNVMDCVDEIGLMSPAQVSDKTIVCPKYTSAKNCLEPYKSQCPSSTNMYVTNAEHLLKGAKSTCESDGVALTSSLLPLLAAAVMCLMSRFYLF